MSGLILPSAPVARGAQSVMAAKRPKQKISAGTPWEELELFPTPPWATRALFHHVLPLLGVSRLGRVREPCAGLGHMSEVLKEFSCEVQASDVHSYALADGRSGRDLGILREDFRDVPTEALLNWWLVTNPPFGLAVELFARAIGVAAGVALLLRLQFLESEEREILFRSAPPSVVAVFSQRVPMSEGGWDPRGDTATAYAWFVWARDPYSGGPVGAARDFRASGTTGFETILIPYGCKEALTRESDRLLATRYVPGWVPPTTIKRAGRQQQDMFA